MPLNKEKQRHIDITICTDATSLTVGLSRIMNGLIAHFSIPCNFTLYVCLVKTKRSNFELSQ